MISVQQLLFEAKLKATGKQGEDKKKISDNFESLTQDIITTDEFCSDCDDSEYTMFAMLTIIIPITANTLPDN